MPLDSQSLKRSLKWAYHLINGQALPKDLNLSVGCVFHTEAIYDDEVFKLLRDFCIRFNNLTGVRAICAVMTGVNPKIAAMMLKYGVSQAEYSRRVESLSAVATIGYHGHHWFANGLWEEAAAEIRCNNFLVRPFADSFERDMGWFRSLGIPFPKSYAAGWWFINSELLTSLIRNDFKLDLSFSKSLSFRNEYSEMVFSRHAIVTGEPFRVISKEGRLGCIQNLMGMNLPLWDFERIFRRLYAGHREMSFMLNAHDFDLKDDAHSGLNLFDDLGKKYGKQIQFCAMPDLLSRFEDSSTNIKDVPIHGRA